MANTRRDPLAGLKTPAADNPPEVEETGSVGAAAEAVLGAMEVVDVEAERKKVVVATSKPRAPIQVYTVHKTVDIHMGVQIVRMNPGDKVSVETHGPERMALLLASGELVPVGG